MSTKIVKLINLCRTCSKNYQKEELIPIFPKGAIKDISRYQNDKLQFIEDDSLPQQICGECLDQFNDMNEFLQRCEDSQKVLEKKFHITDKFAANELLNVTKEEMNDDTATNYDHCNFENKDTFDYEEILGDDENNDVELDDDEDNQDMNEIEDDVEQNDIEILKNDFKVEILSENSMEIENKYLIAEIEEDFDVETELKKAIKAAQEIINNNDTKVNSDDDFLEDYDYENIANYNCELCSEKNMTFHQLKEHKKFKHKTNGRRRKKPSHARISRICDICGETVKSYMMQVHLNNHLGVPNKKYQCEVCNKEYLAADSLKSHMYKHKEPIFFCEYCKKGFRTEKNLILHNESYPKESCLEPRKRVYTSGPKASIQCLYCMKKFLNTVSLINHCKTHKKPELKDAKHICSYCNTVFKRADHLKIHVNSQHLKSEEFKCQYCGKVLYASFRLNRHIKQQHLTVQERPKCEFCKKSFSSPACVKRHQLESHSTEKVYQCPLCDMRFYKNIELAQHSKVHDELIKNETQKELILKEFCPNVLDSSKKSRKSRKVIYEEEIEVDEEYQIYHLVETNDD